MKYIIKGNNGDWELVIGLEVHAQVKSKSKLFSGAATEFGAEPNTQVSLVDAAMPGMLPVLNEFCVEQAVKTGHAINAKVNEYSVFDRKNYFYADLPQGYQISQFYHPIVSEGNIEIDLSDGSTKNIRIERIHLEQDAGKSLHDQSPTSSFIDLNRCGIALMEIVSYPDLCSPDEAVEYMKKLRAILRYIGSCDGDMEKGSLRCDANVSVRPVGETKLGTRCEIKNINSTRNIARAIEYEAKRQVELIENGGKVVQETRLYNAQTNETKTMRSKEDAHDYRYFPDPDLKPLILSKEYINKLKSELPELPDQKKKRYMDMGLTAYDASVIVAEQEVAHYFDEVIKSCDPKMASNWISAELFARLNKDSIDITKSPVSSSQFAELLSLINDDTISGKIAKDVFDIMWQTKKDAKIIVEEQGLKQVTNKDEIIKAIDQIMAENIDKVEQYRSGKDKLFGFFVGQVMKQTQGKANPTIVNDLLKEKLS